MKRKIIKTRDNPLGGYTESLVSRSYELTRMENSKRGFDAKGLPTSERYQIKGAIAKNKEEPQFGTIRCLEPRELEHLVVVIFRDDCTVRKACKIPHEVILEFARRIGRSVTEQYRLNLPDDLPRQDRVETSGTRLLHYQGEDDSLPCNPSL